MQLCSGADGLERARQSDLAVVDRTGLPVGWIGVHRQSALDTSGTLTLADGHAVEIPVAGSGAIASSGQMLVVGGPTSDLLVTSADGGTTWNDLPPISDPELVDPYDFGWWNFGAPGITDNGQFVLPAIWHQTPPDRSYIDEHAYVVILSADLAVIDIVELDFTSDPAASLVVVATTGRVLVADSAGTAALFDSAGRRLSELSYPGTIVGLRVAPDGQVTVDVAASVGESPSAAAGRLCVDLDS